MIATILLFIGECYRYVVAHKRLAVIVAVIAPVAIFGFCGRSCYVRHEIEKTQDAVTNSRIEEANKDAVTKTANAEAEQKKKDAQAASNASKTAIQKANEARNANVKDASSDELHKAHCDAYPEDCK